MSAPGDLLGVHGVTLRVRDPAATARRFQRLLGLSLLRRSRGALVLGDGPELFVAIERARDGEDEGVTELHVATKNVARTRRKTRPDPLGGDSLEERVGPVTIVLRQFRRPPESRWKKARRTR